MAHASRPAHDRVRMYRDAAARVRAVQASVPEKGIVTARLEPATINASVRPPTVEAARESPSLRRNQWIPRPARIGWITIIQRIAAEQLRTVNSRVGDAYAHPDSGAAANGPPAML